MRIKLPKLNLKPKPHTCAACLAPADSMVKMGKHTTAWLCARHAVMFATDDTNDPPLFV